MVISIIYLKGKIYCPKLFEKKNGKMLNGIVFEVAVDNMLNLPKKNCFIKFKIHSKR
jgi:hypothetical protein